MSAAGRPRRTGVLVTGTDTGVGKTRVACALARGLVARGLSVGVMKPCETGLDLDWPPAAPPAGCGPDAAWPGTSLPAGSDAAALAEAAASRDDARQILPRGYTLPAAPAAAAAHAGAPLDLGAIAAAAADLRGRHDLLLVEGAGGLLVPLTADTGYVELARALDLDLVIVARTGLGTLNHTALTEQAARGAGLRVAGIVLNSPDADPSPADRENLACAATWWRAPVLGELPHGAPPDPAACTRLADALLDALA